MKNDIIFENEFGKITEKNISLKYKNGVENIPIKYISSVSFKRRRSIFFTLLGLTLSIVSLSAIFPFIDKLDVFLIGIVAFFFIVGLLISISNWIGHHDLIISVNGQDRKPIKVEMSKTESGVNFAKAINRIISR